MAESTTAAPSDAVPDPAASAAEPAGKTARLLMRRVDRAVLATSMPDTAEPYGSLVQMALTPDASPILLISTLAQHTKNILRDGRVGLLFDGTAGFDVMLEGPRVSVQGTAQRTDDPNVRQRFLARHPDAAGYAQFGDFAFYRVAVTRAHLVAGFGRITWIAGDAVVLPPAGLGHIPAAEAEIVAHMNADHADAIAAMVEGLLGLSPDGWVMTGMDPDGLDLRRGGTIARLDFDAPVRNAADARWVLTELTRKGRAALTG